MAPLLELREVSKRYRQGRIQALRAVNLALAAGEAVAVLGRSGCGKTTLINVAAGLIRPDEGRVFFDGVEIRNDAQRTALRARRIGIVFQHFHLIPSLTAAENVGIAVGDGGTEGWRARSLRLLGDVGLAKRADHRPAELSVGEQQRVALARALVNEPDLLVADEPTGNLDPETGQSVVALLFGLRSRRSMALLVVTHDNGVAARFERRIRLADGAVAAPPETGAPPIRAAAASGDEGAERARR